MTAEQDDFAGWVVLELMGHRRLGGHATAVQIAGEGFLRIDIPAADDGPDATQYYRPGVVYCLTPVTEETARAVARRAQPAPVARWELAPTKDDADDDWTEEPA